MFFFLFVTKGLVGFLRTQGQQRGQEQPCPRVWTLVTVTRFKTKVLNNKTRSTCTTTSCRRLCCCDCKQNLCCLFFFLQGCHHTIWAWFLDAMDYFFYCCCITCPCFKSHVVDVRGCCLFLFRHTWQLWLFLASAKALGLRFVCVLLLLHETSQA